MSKNKFNLFLRMLPISTPYVENHQNTLYFIILSRLNSSSHITYISIFLFIFPSLFLYVHSNGGEIHCMRVLVQYKIVKGLSWHTFIHVMVSADFWRFLAKRRIIDRAKTTWSIKWSTTKKLLNGNIINNK